MTTENLSQGTRCPGRDLNRVPPEYKSGALPLLQSVEPQSYSGVHTREGIGQGMQHAPCKVLVSTKRPTRRPRSRREDNIKIDAKVGCGLHSDDTGQGQVAGCCEHGNELP